MNNSEASNQVILISLAIVIAAIVIVAIFDAPDSSAIGYSIFVAENARGFDRISSLTGDLELTDENPTTVATMIKGDNGLFTIYGVQKSITLNRIRGGNEVIISISDYPNFIKREEHKLIENLPQFLDLGVGTDAADIKIELEQVYGRQGTLADLSITLLGPVEDPTKPKAEPPSEQLEPVLTGYIPPPPEEPAAEPESIEQPEVEPPEEPTPEPPQPQELPEPQPLDLIDQEDEDQKLPFSTLTGIAVLILAIITVSAFTIRYKQTHKK